MSSRSDVSTRLRRALFAVLGLALGAPALAGPLDPRDFASLGTLDATGWSRYGFVDGNTMEVYDIDENRVVATYQGVDYHGITVFTFDSVDVGAIYLRGEISSYHDTGEFTLHQPLALLSKGDMNVGSVSLSGGYVGGGDVFNDFPRAGAGGGTGGISFADPNQGSISPGRGSDALGLVRAGDGGYGGVFQWGGGGGGAIELGALGQITITGLIDANGGVGQSSTVGTAGDGGGGGGILIHGRGVDLSDGLLSAGGGAGGIDYLNVGNFPDAYGRGGAGGQIKIIYGPGGYVPGFPGSMSVHGGPDLFPGQPPGPDGWISIVPEPTSLALLALGLGVGLGGWRLRWAKARRGDQCGCRPVGEAAVPSGWETCRSGRP